MFSTIDKQDCLGKAPRFDCSGFVGVWNYQLINFAHGEIYVWCRCGDDLGNGLSDAVCSSLSLAMALAALPGITVEFLPTGPPFKQLAALISVLLFQNGSVG